MARKTIVVDGVEYPVIKNHRYQHGEGMYARLVKVEEGVTRMAVSRRAGGPWRWWQPKSRVWSSPTGRAEGRDDPDSES